MRLRSFTRTVTALTSVLITISIYSAFELAIQFDLAEAGSERAWFLLDVIGIVTIASCVLLIFVERRFDHCIKALVRTVASEMHSPKPVDYREKDDTIAVLEEVIADLLLKHRAVELEAKNLRDGRSQLASRICFQARTPIHSILGMLRMLQRETTNPLCSSYIKMASFAADNLLNTVDDLVQFGEHLEDVLKPQLTECSLHALVNNATRTIAQRVYERSGIDLLVDIDTQLAPSYWTDPKLLVKALGNVLNNAVRYTDHGAIKLDVRFSESATGNKIQFKVSDSGKGMSKLDLEKLWQVIADSDTPSSHGLVGVFYMAKSLGGQLIIESSAEPGTEVLIELPYDQAPTEAVKMDISLAGPLLILSPNGYTAEFLVNVFASYSIRTSACSNISQAKEWKLLTAGQQTLVLDGAILESELGWDFLREWGAQHAYADSVIALLNPAHVAIASRLADLGINRYCWKPVSTPDLLKVLSVINVVTNASEEPYAKLSASARKLRILIADDVSTNQIILQDLLEEAGHEVLTVSNGQELLERLALMSGSARSGYPFDLLFTDIEMPVIDGLTAIKRIREGEHHSKENLPIIALTAHALAEEQRVVLAAGADAVITKPIQINELDRLLQRFGSN